MTIERGGAPSPGVTLSMRRAIFQVRKNGARRLTLEAPVLVLDRDLEQIAAHQRRDAGVVDQAVDAAEGIEGGVDQRLLGREIGDVGDQESAVAAALGDAGQRLLGVWVALQIGDHQIEAGVGQGIGAAATDATAPAGRPSEFAVLVLARSWLSSRLRVDAHGAQIPGRRPGCRPRSARRAGAHRHRRPRHDSRPRADSANHRNGSPPPSGQAAARAGSTESGELERTVLGLYDRRDLLPRSEPWPARPRLEKAHGGRERSRATYGKTALRPEKQPEPEEILYGCEGAPPLPEMNVFPIEWPVETPKLLEITRRRAIPARRPRACPGVRSTPAAFTQDQRYAIAYSFRCSRYSTARARRSSRAQ